MKRAAAIGVAVAVAVAVLGFWLWHDDAESAPVLAPLGAAPIVVAAAPSGPQVVVRPSPVIVPALADASVADAGSSADGPGARPADAGAAPGAAAPVVAVAAAEYAGLEVDAGPAAVGAARAPRPADPRFTVRWGKPGLCTEELDARRAAMLARMSPNAAGDAVVYHAGPVAPLLLEQIAYSMLEARTRAAELVDWSAVTPHPLIYLYDSLEQLREVSCVNQQAIGYYDGAIHLAAGADLERGEVRATLRHEYMHHVLISSGVRLPMWLHEGLAMYAAEETWWMDERLGLRTWLKSNHLPFAAMVSAFPHTADRLFALAAYFQSERMVTFIVRERGVEHLRVVVRALSRGQVTPEDAFYWGVGLSAAGTEQRWDQVMAE